MIKITKIMCCIAILAIYPYAVKADFDPTTFVQDQIKVHNEEINKIVGQYVKIQIDMQKLINSKDKLRQLKEMGKGFINDQISKAKEMGKQIVKDQVSNVMDKVDLKKVNQVSLKGIGKEIKGQFSNGKLASIVGKKMTTKKNSANDISVARQHNEMINDLQIENLAGMYAKALVRRKAIMDEDKKLEEEEKTEQTDLSMTKDAYKIVNDRANGRWKSILDSNTNYQSQLSTSKMLIYRISNEEEAEEAMKNAEDEKTAKNESKNSSKTSLKEMYKKGKSAYKKAKSGDYSGLMGDISGSLGDFGKGDLAKYVDSAAKGAVFVNSAVKAGQSGDWSGVAGSLSGALADIGGQYVGEDTAEVFNKINTGTNFAGKVGDKIKNKDYGGALSNLAIGVSATGGNKFNDKTKDVLDVIGGSAGAINTIIDTGKNMKGKKFKDKVKTIGKGAKNIYKDVKRSNLDDKINKFVKKKKAENSNDSVENVPEKSAKNSSENNNNIFEWGNPLVNNQENSSKDKDASNGQRNNWREWGAPLNNNSNNDVEVPLKIKSGKE